MKDIQFGNFNRDWMLENKVSQTSFRVSDACNLNYVPPIQLHSIILQSPVARIALL